MLFLINIPETQILRLASLAQDDSIYSTNERLTTLKRQARTHLNLPPGRRDFRDASEARCIYKTVWRSQVGVVEGIEELCARFKPCLLRHAELAHDAEVHGLHSGTIHRVAPHIAVGVSRGSRKRVGIEPCGRVASAGAKDLLSGEVGADGVLSDDRSGIGGIAEDRDGEREAALHLIFHGAAPVAGED